MDDLEKQLMDMSGIKEPEAPAVPEAPSAVKDTDYSAAHRSRLSPVRTFSSDLANAVREHGGSVVRVAIAEEEKHRHEYEESSIRSKKNIAFTIGGIILVLGSIGAGIYAYQYRKAASVEIPVVTAVPESLIDSDASVTIDTGGMQVSDIYAGIHAVVADPGIEPGLVKNIILTKTENGALTRPSASTLLAALGMHLPSDLSRALSSDYMLGVYLYSKSNLFMVVHGTAHDFLLAGMLGWEPYLFEDMVPLFSIDTSGFSKVDLQNVKFEDAVIGNRDARAVLDINRKPLLYYSFIDQDTILIASDPKTLTEVVRRY